MSEKLAALKTCVERGKSTKDSPHPPDMKGQPGAVEIVQELMAEKVTAETILNEALIPAMREVGRKFQCNEIYIPQMLIAADAMKNAMAPLREELAQTDVKPRGTFIIGTVQGDLHDIGKNLVIMMTEGAGWKVVDLGVDVTPQKFLEAVESNPGAVVGMSSLLTTTMGEMRSTLAALREKHPDLPVIIGGAPVTQEFADQIEASGYAPGPQEAIDLLDKLAGVA